MSLNSIEIMCIPCPKCENMKRLISEVIKQIELQNKIKLACEIKHTPNIRQASQYNANPAQAPIVIINGQLELSGPVTRDLVNKKLLEIHRN